jgi:HK97 family phage major capsid protein
MNATHFRRNILKPVGAVLFLLLTACVLAIPCVVTADVVSSCDTATIPTENLAMAGLVGAVTALAAGKTVPATPPGGAVNYGAMPWEELETVYNDLLTKTENLEGLNGENLDKLGADDAKTYADSVKQLEAVNEARNNHPRGMYIRRQKTGLVLNAMELGSLRLRSVVEDDPSCGYGADNNGAVQFLRDVVIATTSGRNLETDRFRHVAKRTAYNRLRDKTKPEFQKDVWNAIGSDEYAFERWQDGGLLIPKKFMTEVQRQTAPSDMLTSLMKRLPMEVPELSIPFAVDKNHSESYTGGTRVYRKAEFQSADPSKDTMETIAFKANELIGTSIVSDMLLRYSPMTVATMLRNAFDSAFDYKRMEEFLYGDGQGRPLGMFHPNNGSILTVAREAGQAAADIVNGKNILRMKQRAFRYSQCYWICNPDLLYYIAQLHIESTNNAGILKFFSPGVDGSPPTIDGRPVIVTEHNQGAFQNAGAAITDWRAGYLGLFNPNEYGYGELYEEEAVSAHVRFEQRSKMYLFVKADDGRPMWKTFLTPKRGLTTISPFVLLGGGVAATDI